MVVGDGGDVADGFDGGIGFVLVEGGDDGLTGSSAQSFDGDGVSDTLVWQLLLLEDVLGGGGSEFSSIVADDPVNEARDSACDVRRNVLVVGDLVDALGDGIDFTVGALGWDCGGVAHEGAGDAEATLDESLDGSVTGLWRACRNETSRRPAMAKSGWGTSPVLAVPASVSTPTAMVGAPKESVERYPCVKGGGCSHLSGASTMPMTSIADEMRFFSVDSRLLMLVWRGTSAA